MCQMKCSLQEMALLDFISEMHNVLPLAENVWKEIILAELDLKLEPKCSENILQGREVSRYFSCFSDTLG